jgi:hypothetical protein
MRPVERLAVLLYERPRLRRAWLVTCGLWFGAAWALLASPTAAAAGSGSSGGTYSTGQAILAWTGLYDTYGMPISDYYISTVPPLVAADNAMASQGGFDLFDPDTWASGIVRGWIAFVSNWLGAGAMAFECAIFVFIGGVGIWFLKFAMSSSWLVYLAQIAQVPVSTLQQLVNQYYVLPIALLVCILWGGIVWLTKSAGKGLGMILGGFGIIVLLYWLFSNPIQEILGPNGIIAIGRYFGLIVAEGVINNGALTSGNPADAMTSLVGLLCTALVREQVQMMNFGTVIDAHGGCASMWNNALLTGQTGAPYQAVASCDPAAAAYADQIGLQTAGWFLVIILVEFVIMLCLAYVGFHVIVVGFNAFFNVLVLVVAVPMAVAPGPTRRFAGHRVRRIFADGVEVFASTAALAIIVVMIGEVLSGSVTL